MKIHGVTLENLMLFDKLDAMFSPNANIICGENSVGSLVIVKLDAVTGKPSPDAEFKVTTASGELVANNGGRISSNGFYITDENGQIILTNLTSGVYIITETKARKNTIYSTPEKC